MAIDLAERAVLAAAEQIKRGCDCEYDYRCGNCENIVTLREAVATLHAARAKAASDA